MKFDNEKLADLKNRTDSFEKMSVLLIKKMNNIQRSKECEIEDLHQIYEITDNIQWNVSCINGNFKEFKKRIKEDYFVKNYSDYSLSEPIHFLRANEISEVEKQFREGMEENEIKEKFGFSDSDLSRFITKMKKRNDWLDIKFDRAQVILKRKIERERELMEKKKKEKEEERKKWEDEWKKARGEAEKD